MPLSTSCWEQQYEKANASLGWLSVSHKHMVARYRKQNAQLDRQQYMSQPWGLGLSQETCIQSVWRGNVSNCSCFSGTFPYSSITKWVLQTSRKLPHPHTFRETRKDRSNGLTAFVRFTAVKLATEKHYQKTPPFSNSSWCSSLMHKCCSASQVEQIVNSRTKYVFVCVGVNDSSWLLTCRVVLWSENGELKKVVTILITISVTYFSNTESACFLSLVLLQVWKTIHIKTKQNINKNKTLYNNDNSLTNAS